MNHFRYATFPLLALPLLLGATPEMVSSPAQAHAESTTEDRVLGEYRKEIIKAIKEKIHNEEKRELKGTMLVEIKIQRLGIVSSSSVIKSSLNAETDRVVIKAVEVGTLLPRPPAETGGEDLKIQISLKFVQGRIVEAALKDIDEKPDCAALLKTNISYEATIRSDNKTLIKSDKTVAHLDPDSQQLRVNRMAGGYVEAISRRSPAEGKFVSHKLYDNTIYSINEKGERIEYRYDPPLRENVPPGKENSTEIYTRTMPGGPPQRRRVETIFEREDVFEVSSCKIPVYRYRVDVFSDPSSGQAPLSTTVKDYSPDLRIALRQQSSGPSSTATRTVLYIATDFTVEKNR